MKFRLGLLALAVGAAIYGGLSHADDAAPATPFKVVKSVTVGGMGGWDYVCADADSGKLYVPRGNRVDAYDLDTLAAAGSIANTTGVHGVAVATEFGHGFCSSNPVVEFDTPIPPVFSEVKLTTPGLSISSRS